MPHKIIMNSGRVYEIHDYHEKDYVNDWIYFRDEDSNTILGVSKSSVEAEVWQDDDEYWTQSTVNGSNA